MSEINLPTQIELNEAFEESKAIWDRAVFESGKTQAVFIATDRTGFVGQFMTEYEVARQAAESIGLVMPELIEGLKVTITESNGEDNE